MPAFKSIADVRAEVDLAVVVVPAAVVVDVARECAAAKVGALLVISAGFAETGAAGAERQRELVSVSAAPACAWSDPTAWACSNSRPRW